MSGMEIAPVGRVRNAVTEWVDVTWEQVVSEIVLEPEWTEALDGLDQFSHIWVVAWLDRLPAEERGARAKVHPEGRQDLPAVGLFATRTPRRPNPISITAVRLVARRDNVLTVKGLDLLDGTPVLDVKPYLSRGDRIARPRQAPWLQLLRR